MYISCLCWFLFFLCWNRLVFIFFPVSRDSGTHQDREHSSYGQSGSVPLAVLHRGRRMDSGTPWVVPPCLHDNVSVLVVVETVFLHKKIEKEKALPTCFWALGHDGREGATLQKLSCDEDTVTAGPLPWRLTSVGTTFFQVGWFFILLFLFLGGGGQENTPLEPRMAASVIMINMIRANEGPNSQYLVLSWRIGYGFPKKKKKINCLFAGCGVVVFREPPTNFMAGLYLCFFPSKSYQMQRCRPFEWKLPEFFLHCSFCMKKK